MRDSWWLVLQTSGAKIYWVVATLLTSVVTARYLGVDGRGVFVAAVGWVTLFSTVGHLSMGQVVIHIAAKSGGEAWLPRVLGSVLSLLGATALLGWGVAAALYFGSAGRLFPHIAPSVLAVAMAALPLMMWIETGNGMLLAVDGLPVMNLAQAAGATTTLALTFVVLRLLHFELKGALAATLVAQALTVAISLGHLLRRSPSLSAPRDTIREVLSGGLKLHLNAVGTYLFMQATVLILNHYRTPRETAFYQLAVQLMTGMQIIPLAVSAVAYSLVAKLGPDAAWPRQKRLLLQVVLVVGAAGVVGYFAAPYAIRVVFGAEFLPTVPLFRLLLPGLIGMAITIVMASQWIARGLFLQAAAVTLAVGAASVAANMLLVPRYGTVAAAWITVATYFVTMMINIGVAIWVDRTSRSALARALST